MRKGPFKEHHKQFLASGGGAVCTVREELKRVVKRPNEKNAIRKFGGECECVGDADHRGGCKSVPSNKGGVNLSRLTSSSSGVSSFVCFCSLIATYYMYATAVHTVYEATA